MPEITLLTTKGTVHNTAGLNWGSNHLNHTTPLDAYIPIHIGFIRSNPGLIEPKSDTQRTINCVWDDGVQMTLLFEGNLPDSSNGIVYPKQIASHPSKNTLGTYLRRRLGLRNNEIITLQHLQDYGRMSVTIIKIDSLNYRLDFSRPV